MTKADKVFEDFKVDADFPHLGPRTMLLNARKIKTTSAGSKPLILLAMEDVTGRKSREGGERA